MSKHIHIYLHHRSTDRAAPDWPELYRDLAERMSAALAALPADTKDADWKEDLHPRADNGQFGEGGGGAQSFAGSAKPTSVTAKGNFAGLHQLLSSGHSFSKAELMSAVGIVREKQFSDYMAMLKNPKYAGKLGALKIERTAEGSYRVMTAAGTPAPPNPAPTPAKAPGKPAAPATVSKAPTPAVATALPKAGAVKYVPQKTAKDAAAFAVANNYVDRSDFGTCSTEAANAMITSLSEHLAEFPGLRSGQNFAGSTQAFYKHWRESAIQERIGMYKWTIPELSPAEAQHRAEVNVRKPKAPARAWALSHRGLVGFNGITFNQKHTGKAGVEKMEVALKYSVAKKFHPEGCDTLKSLADHEYGHQLDGLLGLSGMREITELNTEAKGGKQWGPDVTATITNNVSKYAATNVAEFIAESWSEYRNNPNPRPIAQKMGAIIKAEYEKQKHKFI